MHRSVLFWKMLLPGVALITATGLVMTADALSAGVRLGLFVALVAAAVLHARWLTGRLARVAASLTVSIRRMGTADDGPHWSDAIPAELAPLVEAIEDLERRRIARIAELDRLSREHADSTALLQAVLRTMAEGVVVLDSDQRIVFHNTAARPLLDLQARDVLGRPIWEVSRLVQVPQLAEGVLANGEARQGEYEIPRTQLSVAVTATALPRSPVPGVMLVLRDVSELRRLERMRRDFVSNVSHELKTPLTSIQAYADTLLDGDLRDVRASRDFLEKIIEQSERLGAIIVDIIRLGKIESEPDAYEIRPVAVGPAVHACVEAHLRVAETNGIALSAGAVPEEATVLADQGELGTILDNLVDNALHYTPRGGSITVGITAAASQQDMIGIEVADTGIGIPKDQQARIFERFYRVDRARDRQRGGTGLGLSIVKHLCGVFGGRVEVHSEQGVGTRFTVWLPRGDRPDETASTAKARTALHSA